MGIKNELFSSYPFISAVEREHQFIVRTVDKKDERKAYISFHKGQWEMAVFGDHPTDPHNHLYYIRMMDHCEVVELYVYSTQYAESEIMALVQYWSEVDYNPKATLTDWIEYDARRTPALILHGLFFHDGVRPYKIETIQPGRNATLKHPLLDWKDAKTGVGAFNLSPRQDDWAK